MCIICILIEKDKLTSQEATRAFNSGEVELEEGHDMVVLEKIWGKWKEERPEAIPSVSTPVPDSEDYEE